MPLIKFIRRVQIYCYRKRNKTEDLATSKDESEDEPKQEDKY